MYGYLIGVDNGGTVSKATVFDLSGNELAVSSKMTPLITPQPGFNERNMDQLWMANCICIKDALEKSAVNPRDIRGVAVCGHGKGLYLWGKNDKPIYNGIVSTDNRAWSYIDKWYKEETHASLYNKLCQELIPSQPAALLAWIKEHERDTYNDIKWVFSVKDYIRFRLTGEAASEITDLSGSGLMDVSNVKIDFEIFKALGIEEVAEKIPPLCLSSEVCGYITSEASALTGLPEGIPVAGGMFDIDACALAMDITMPEQLCTITGTWSINQFISSTPVLGTQIAMNSLYAIPGYYLLEECSPTSAGNLDWIIQNCIGDIPRLEGKSIYRQVDEMVTSIKPDECEVYYLPFLYGSNAHPLAKASLIGLTTYHNKSHILRSVYEGVAYSHKSHIDKLLTVRDSPYAIRMAGGAANSSVWVQIFADVLNFPIETVYGVSEIGTLGAAMSAAVATGIYDDYPSAAKVMVKVNPPIFPNKDKAEIYIEKYKIYNLIKTNLDSVWGTYSI